MAQSNPLLVKKKYFLLHFSCLINNHSKPDFFIYYSYPYTQMLWDSLYYPKPAIMKLKPVRMFRMQLSYCNCFTMPLIRRKWGIIKVTNHSVQKSTKPFPWKENHMNNKGSWIISHKTEKLCITVIRAVKKIQIFISNHCRMILTRENSTWAMYIHLKMVKTRTGTRALVLLKIHGNINMNF